MAKRLKWLMIKTKFDLNELHSFFFKHTFSSLSEFGFLNIQGNENKVSSTYIEKQTSHQEYIDPLGVRYEQKLISYVEFDFLIEYIDKDYLLLSIINPPKSIKKFVSFICESFNYMISFGAVNLCLIDVIDKIKSHSEIHLFVIKKINISGLKLNDSSTASVEIISKNNALKEVDIYTNGLSYSIEKIKGTMLFHDRKIGFEVSKSSLFISDDEFEIGLFNKIIYK